MYIIYAIIILSLGASMYQVAIFLRISRVLLQLFWLLDTPYENLITKNNKVSHFSFNFIRKSTFFHFFSKNPNLNYYRNCSIPWRFLWFIHRKLNFSEIPSGDRTEKAIESAIFSGDFL